MQKNTYSEDIVKEISVCKGKSDILMLVPMEEAKETDEEALEKIVSEILSTVSEEVLPIKYQAEANADDDAVTVVISFQPEKR